MNGPRAVHRAAAAAVLLGAFGLRVFRLDYQSLWADEGASVVMTYRSAAQIVEAAAGDIHPPLYYLALAAWSAFSGRSEYGLRFLSVVFGVALIAVVARLGGRILDRPTGLLAALFAAGSPLLIYYSQEMRMYEQMALLGCASILCGVEALRVAGPRRAALFAAGGVLGGLAALTQYFGASAVLAGAVAAPLLARGRGWFAGVAGWAAMSVLSAGMIFPWVVYASGQLQSWSVDSEPIAPGAFALQTLRVYAFGLAWDETATEKTLGLMAGLAVASALWAFGAHGRVRDRALRLAATWGIALAAPGLLFLVALNRPVYNPKFLLVGVVGWCIVIAAGASGAGQVARRWLRPASLARIAGALLPAAAIVAAAFAVQRAQVAAYDNPKHFRDDYRGLLAYVEAASRTGDVVVLNAPGQREIVEYYYRGAAPLVGLPPRRPPNDAETERALADLSRTSSRVWLVLWASEQADPRNVVEGWLNANAFRVFNRWYGGVRLVLYSLPRAGGQDAPQFPLAARFEQGVELEGYSITARDAAPGEALQLTLFWKADGPTRERYTVFTHLIDDRQELIWGQRDAEPASGGRPTTGWQPAERIPDRYGIPILPGTPPGSYYVEVGLYRASDGVRLGALDPAGRVSADRVLFGPFEVGRPARQPSIAELQIDRPASGRLGPLQTLGFAFHRLGQEPTERVLAPGGLAQLTLFARIESAFAREPELEIRFVGADSSALSSRAPAFLGLAAPAAFAVGDVARIQQKVAAPTQRGTYRLVAAIGGESVDLGTFEVR